MENRVLLKRYRLSLDRNDLPVQLHRTPTSVTYRAQEIGTGREVALERVTADIPTGAFREVLESEAAIAQQINHLNVPALYDFGFDEDELIFVTEYLEGRTAAAWVAARGPLAPPAVLRVALQIVSAMGAMAFDRIYHHALNPENIIFLNAQTEADDWPPIKVLHWLGVAPLFTEVGDADLDYAARFTSPEQLYTGRVDLRSEIYALGCTMWFLLTGAPPITPEPGTGFSVKSASELDFVPKIVRHLILRMLHPEPDERPQDPVALKSILQTCLDRVERKERGRASAAIPFIRETKAVKQGRRIPFAPKTVSLAALLIALALLGAVELPRFVGAHNATLPRFKSNEAALASRNEMALPKRPVTPMAATQTRSESGPGSETGSRSQISSSSKTSPVNEIASGDETGPLVEVPTHSAGIVERAPAAAAEPPPPEEGPAKEVGTPVTSVVAKAKTAVGSSPTSAEPKTRPILTAKNESRGTVQFPNVAASGPAPLTNEASTSASATPIRERDATHTNPLQTAPDDSSDYLTDEPGQKIAVDSQPPVAEEAGSVEGPPTPAVAGATPAKKVAHSSPAPAIKSSSTRKSKSAAVARKSSTKTQSRKPASSRQAEVRRPRKIPQLYFGSSPAELVGTTRDGQWILSVKSTGKKFIVPPPPGFAQK
jgi:serine/threonine protein kinase